MSETEVINISLWRMIPSLYTSKVWLRLATLVFICWIDCCLDVVIWTASDSEMINETMMTVIVVV